MIEFIEQSNPLYGPPAPVPIIQEEADFSQLLALYRQREPKSVLEIGTYKGGTFFHWLQNATPGSLVVSVDDYEEADNSHLYPEWCAPAVRYEVIRGNTLDIRTVEAAWAFAPYDFIFIDGGHRDGEVRNDWKRYGRPMVAEHGIVAFHDITYYHDLPRVQVYLLWDELRLKYKYEEYVSDGSSGIGVLYT
jgi:predicted O-methyltransferase YrrM